jgi:DNA-binding NarL/FixJ family response regulator
MTISVLLIDDHDIFRRSMRAFLEATTNYCIVGEGWNGMDALMLSKRLRPDVLVLDYMMPYLDGASITHLLHSQLPEIKVVIISMHDDDFYVSSAIQNGASGYILKEDIAVHLGLAVFAAANNKFYLSPSLQNRESVIKMDLNAKGNFSNKFENSAPAAAHTNRQQAAFSMPISASFHPGIEWKGK